MNNIRLYIAALLLTVSSMAKAQVAEPYLNVQLEDRSYRSFPVTADLEISWGKRMDFVPEYVDLGLPSGTLWATCNVGAYNPEEYGDYFAWGETTPKTNYDWSTYKFGSEPNNASKYNPLSDNKMTLESVDDAATVNWGSEWRMATLTEWSELKSNCTRSWTTQNGVTGCLYTSRVNGNTLFLPAAGYRTETDLSYATSRCHYWTNSLSLYYANHVEVTSSGQDDYGQERRLGLSVRPVRKKITGTAKRTGNVNVNWVQLWAGGPKWAEYNVDASTESGDGSNWAWGAYTINDSFDYNDSNTPLTGSSDIATRKWGDNWRMPRKEEFDALLANCDVELVTVNSRKGRRFTGRGFYSSNSVFFPAAGYGYEEDSPTNKNLNGIYWSSTPKTDYEEGDELQAWGMGFTQTYLGVTLYERKYTNSVRAVLAEE